MRVRKRRMSLASRAGETHRFAFLVKICSDSQPCTTARSTALATPPATDICAPIRSMPHDIGHEGTKARRHEDTRSFSSHCSREKEKGRRSDHRPYFIPKPEARSPKPEARSPKPEARSPKPEARSPLRPAAYAT